MKILVVDDEFVSRHKMARILGKLGECHPVDGGNRAISHFISAWKKWQPYDLITLDISMPDKDGIEVVLELREVEEDKGISPEKRAKVLMVTASSDRESVVTSIQAGCDDYIVKPFDSDSVLQKLKKMGFDIDQ